MRPHGKNRAEEGSCQHVQHQKEEQGEGTERPQGRMMTRKRDKETPQLPSSRGPHESEAFGC